MLLAYVRINEYCILHFSKQGCQWIHPDLICQEADTSSKDAHFNMSFFYKLPLPHYPNVSDVMAAGCHLCPCHGLYTDINEMPVNICSVVHDDEKLPTPAAFSPCFHVLMFKHDQLSADLIILITGDSRSPIQRQADVIYLPVQARGVYFGHFNSSNSWQIRKPHKFKGADHNFRNPTVFVPLTRFNGIKVFDNTV